MAKLDSCLVSEVMKRWSLMRAVITSEYQTVTIMSFVLTGCLLVLALILI